MPNNCSKSVLLAPGPPEVLKRLRSLLALAGYPVLTSDPQAPGLSPGDTRIDYSHSTDPQAPRLYPTHYAEHPSSSQKSAQDSSQALSAANTLVIATAHSPYPSLLPDQKVINLPGIEDSSWFSPSVQADFLCQVDQFFYPDSGPVGILFSNDILSSEQSTQANPLVLGSLLAQALSTSSWKTRQKMKKAPETGLLALGETPWWWRGQGVSAKKINEAETHYLAHTLQRLIPPAKELKCALLCDLNQLSRSSITRLLPVLARAYPWIVVAGVSENKLYFAGNLNYFPIPIEASYPQARKIRYLLEVGINPLFGQGIRQLRYFERYWLASKQQGNHPSEKQDSPTPANLVKVADPQETNYE